ncbi:MAG: hypothetical protein IKU36_05955 [Bacteroidales bacterium]|nr:hypothetical protein [Bacteroidales bacterium]
MRRLFIISALLLVTSSCEEYKLRKQTMAEYSTIFSKVQELERTINSTDFKTLSGNELIAIHEVGGELYYDFNPLGLKPDQYAACESLKDRVKNLKEDIIEKTEAEIADFKISPYVIEDVLFEQTQAYPVYLLKGEKLRWSINAQKPITVKLCNADARSVIKTYTGKTSISDSLEVQNTAIYFLEVIPGATQYIDLDINYKVKEFARLRNAAPIKTEQVECSKGDFGAVAVPGVKMQNLFEEPRKFTLRGQLKSAFSGSSIALVPVIIPAGATDILYSMRMATSEQDRSSDGEFHDNMTRTYTKIKFMGLPLYEKSTSNGLLNTLLDDNRPLRDEDAYCNMYVFRSQTEAKKFQDGKAAAGDLKYDLDYSTVGTQSCNGRIPTNGASKLYLGFENVRVRYANYLWVEAVAVIPTTEYYTTRYSIDK